MLVTMYLAATLSAAPIPVPTAVYRADKKAIPAQQVVLRVSRGGCYGGRARGGFHHRRSAGAMPCFSGHSNCGTAYSGCGTAYSGCGTSYSAAGAWGHSYGAACGPGGCYQGYPVQGGYQQGYQGSYQGYPQSSQQYQGGQQPPPPSGQGQGQGSPSDQAPTGGNNAPPPPPPA